MNDGVGFGNRDLACLSFPPLSSLWLCCCLRLQPSKVILLPSFPSPLSLYLALNLGCLFPVPDNRNANFHNSLLHPDQIFYRKKFMVSKVNVF